MVKHQVFEYTESHSFLFARSLTHTPKETRCWLDAIARIYVL
jgi:hypothetical protein